MRRHNGDSSGYGVGVSVMRTRVRKVTVGGVASAADCAAGGGTGDASTQRAPRSHTGTSDPPLRLSCGWLPATSFSAGSGERGKVAVPVASLGAGGSDARVCASVAERRLARGREAVAGRPASSRT